MTEIDVRGVRVDFPFEPYPAQLEFMEKAMESFQRGVHALLESPTGTGKTLCLLCAAAAYVLSQRPTRHAPHRRRIRLDCDAHTPDSDAEVEHSLPFSAMSDTTTQSPSASPAGTGRGYEGAAAHLAQAGNTNNGSRSSSSSSSAFPAAHSAPHRGCFIVYCSRTHAQLTQVIRELKRTRYAAELSMALLGSREHMCVNAEVVRLPSLQAQQSMCNTLRAERGCRFFRGLHSGKAGVGSLSTSASASSSAAGAAAHSLLDAEKQIHDMEDLLREGRRCGFCPYYYERQASCHADIIFMPYNYIVDPLLRRQLPFDLKQCILIMDEAHNLPGVLSSSGCLHLHPLDLTQAIHDCTRAMAAVRLLGGGGGGAESERARDTLTKSAPHTPHRPPPLRRRKRWRL